MPLTDTLRATSTWAEIHQQPDLWESWAAAPALAQARDWLKGQAPREFWLMGAGTSAYTGDIIAAGLEGAAGPRLRAVPTTDLVARPRAFLPTEALVVQFSRSGDSTESVGTLDALDALSPATPRLHVTCNPKGALATRPAPGPLHVLLLPEAAHDAGFAMTSSFTTMMLSALALLLPEGAAPLPALAARLRVLLPAIERRVAATPMPDRLVFLGTGPLMHAARECTLKVLELTKGAIPVLWDSPLAFRHGPKSFVRPGTEIVLLLSPDRHAALYEADLLAELRAQYPANRLTTVGPGGDLDLPMPEGAAWGAAPAIAFAQVLGAALSDRLGFQVDAPFQGEATLSRVVTGVRLHGP